MALSKARNTRQRGSGPKQHVYSFPVKSGKLCYQGGIAALDSGFVKPAVTATGLLCVGKFRDTVDNSSGSDGDLDAEVIPGTHSFANSANADEIAQADVGGLCYLVDDQTVAKTDGTGSRSIAGTVVAIDDDGQVQVEMGLAPAVDGTALAAEITARQAISTDLASTANAKGASLVGIEDAAGIYTATTVEGALAERTDGEKVADVTDDSGRQGVPVALNIAIADGVTADKDVVLTFKMEIVDVIVQKRGAAGGASDTIQLKTSGGTAITNAMDINVADKTIVRAGTIDDAQSTIAAAGTLRVTKTKASAANVACQVTVIGFRRA